MNKRKLKELCFSILGLPGNATNIAVCGEMGQFTIHLYWIENKIKYWCRVSKTDLPILPIFAIYDAVGLSYKFNLAIFYNADDHVNGIMT